MAITISKLHHAGFLITDLNRACDFYERVMGFESLERPDFGFPGRWYDLKNGNQLHLMCIDDMPLHSTGIPSFDRHIALEVPDIEKTAEELTTLGVDFTRGNGRGGAAQLFLRDPDGNLIELR